MRTERLAGEVATALEHVGIATILLKGSVLGQWLYPGHVRVYGDADLLVSPSSWERALIVLDSLGFEKHPRSTELTQFGPTHARTLMRSGLCVDLHRALPGLRGDTEMIWQSLLARAKWQNIAGVDIRVPDHVTLLLHIALHAAQHAGEPALKTFEDLRRAITIALERQWRCALELAYTYEGAAAFVSGLRMLPEGQQLLNNLDVEIQPSLQHELRRHSDPIVEEIGGLLWAPGNLRFKITTMMHMLFPSPEYMRNWSTLATRGKLGLVASYVWRFLWAIGHTPRAGLAVCRVYRHTKGEWSV
jgi:hypothetical protein